MKQKTPELVSTGPRLTGEYFFFFLYPIPFARIAYLPPYCWRGTCAHGVRFTGRSFRVTIRYTRATHVQGDMAVIAVLQDFRPIPSPVVRPFCVERPCFENYVALRNRSVYADPDRLFILGQLSAVLAAAIPLYIVL